MKISVVIPTFNREHFICHAIDSVLKQSLSDCEIIVVDDGSTDNTRDVLKAYGKRIRYFYKENEGVALARNFGMKEARGEYISWLDSDDLYYPHKNELQSAFLDKFPDIGMVYSEFSGFDDNGFFSKWHLKGYHSSAYRDPEMSYENIFDKKVSVTHINNQYPEFGDRNIYIGNIFDAYFQNTMVFTNSIMFRRSLLDNIGFQNSSFGLFHDMEFVLRYCKRNEIAFLDIPTYQLRFHDTQISGNFHKTDITTVIEKQKSLLKIGKAYGVDDRLYYLKNKPVVDKRMAVLHEAVAIPLTATRSGSKAARDQLKQSSSYGYPDFFLWALTFFPYSLRRLALKIRSILLANGK